MNSSKNKLNSKIILIFNPNPNAHHVIPGMFQVNVAYKSIPIRCVKCQIFGIWHAKYQKTTHIRCSKCQNIWHEWTVPSQKWKHTDRKGKSFIIFILFSLFSLLSHHFIPFFFLSSIILSQTFVSTHLFFHSFFFSLLLLFSLSFSLSAPPNADLYCYGCFFFFFGSDLMGGFRWWWVDRWWWG